MTKAALVKAREQTQEDLRTFLDGMPHDSLDRVCQIVVDNFAPLVNGSREIRSIVTKQIGEQGFRVVKTTNLLEIKIGSMVTPEQAEKMRADGINFTVMRNS